jgi:hypothetical protein
LLDAPRQRARIRNDAWSRRVTETMPLESWIMFAVAAVIGIVGLWMVLQLRRPLTQGRVYAFRMVGIMALSGAIVLAMSAYAMWAWSVAP